MSAQVARRTAAPVALPMVRHAPRPRLLTVVVVRQGTGGPRSAVARLAILRTGRCGPARLLAVVPLPAGPRGRIRGTAGPDLLPAQRPALARVLRRHGWRLAETPARSSRVPAPAGGPLSHAQAPAPTTVLAATALPVPSPGAPGFTARDATAPTPASDAPARAPRSRARAGDDGGRWPWIAVASAITLAGGAMFGAALWFARPPAVPTPEAAPAVDARAWDTPAASPGLAAAHVPRLHLTGVMSGPSGTGIALISNEDGASRAYPVGAPVDGDLVLMSLTDTRASLGPAGQAPTLVLDLEVPAAHAPRPLAAGDLLGKPVEPGTEGASYPADDLTPPPDSTAATGKQALSRGRHMRLRR